MKVLFICTGNTCRSPMAAALLKQYSPDMEVKSAGIFAMNGQPANENSIMVLEEKGIKLDHHSLSVTTELLEWADLILTMTKAHKMTLTAKFPGFLHKVATLPEYVQSSQASETKDIADPFGYSIDIYRNTLDELDCYIKKLIEKI